jgi:ribosome-binding protein aMBF1 (putative translation factor)
MMRGTSEPVVKTQIVGPLIKKNRKKLQLTQKELAAKLGYKYGNFIGMLEKGQAIFPIERWEQFAKVLEIPAHEILRAIFEERYPRMLYVLDFHESTEHLEQEKGSKSSKSKKA